MGHLPSLRGLLLALLASCALSAPLNRIPGVNCYPAGAAPLPFGASSYGAITLQVATGRWNVDGQVAFNTRAYFYNGVQMIPGPTIHMKAGTQCQITLVNALPTDGQAQCNAEMAAMVPGAMGKYHCPDVTNLHTHGLHISGSQDDVLSAVLPGSEKVYTYDILPQHLMGTHWYHAHKHGATALQVGGGLHGMLLIEPSDADLAALPPDIAALYNAATNAYYYEMVLSHLFFGDGDPKYGDMHEWSYQELWELFPNQTINPQGTIYTSSPNFMVVNGQYQPEIEVSAGSVALLRIVNSGGYRQLVMKFAQQGVCQMRLIARDGIFQKNGYPLISRIVLYPGTRADIAVQCNPGPTVSYPFDVTVFGDDVDIGPLLGNMHVQDCIFKLRVVSEVASQQSPLIAFFPTGQVTYPSYLPDLTNAVPESSRLIDLDSWAVNTQYFWGTAAPLHYIYSFCLDKVYEIWLYGYQFRIDDQGHFPAWSNTNNGHRSLEQTFLGNGIDPTYDINAGLHPYHQHVNSFQVIGVREDCPVDFIRVGEYRDVVAELNNGTVIRFKPHLFTGTAVMHCHYLEHEDMGMMALFNISAC